MSDTDASAESAPRPFDQWNRLPEELRLEVLSHLDYFGLKRARAISKDMKELIETNSFFDLRLFRQKPPMWVETGTHVEIHPMIHDFGGMVRLPVLIWRSCDEGRDAFEYPAANEFATAPACTYMHVELGTGDPLWVRDPTGITVRLLVTKLADFWTQPPSHRHAQAVRQYYGYGQDVDVTKWDILGEWTGWSGWLPAEVDEGGCVCLTANQYEH